MANVVLEEVQVTSSPTLKEVNVSGVHSLEEVEVTSNPTLGEVKTNATPIVEEVQLTSTHSLDEVNVSGVHSLDEVEVTSSRILDEVQVTSKRMSNTQGAVPSTISEPQGRNAIAWPPLTDWRVRLALSPNSPCLYNDPSVMSDPNSILYPLIATKGVIFPYSPQITMSYSAQYNGIDLTHSNYKLYMYQNSSVDEISLNCNFTAQDTNEANYLIAVIHFFRSVTKMFYGLDQNPKAGTPPPLCYIFGMGKWQYNAQPLVVSGFSYSLPEDIDYVRAGPIPAAPGQNKQQENSKSADTNPTSGDTRSQALPIPKGGAPRPTRWVTQAQQEVTYVPSLVNLQLRLLPVVSRNDVSNNFSLQKYANGTLLDRNNNYGTGFW